MSTLKMAVIGVGRIGINHARILSDMPNVALVAVVDPDSSRAQKAAKRYGATPYTDVATLFAQEQIDAVDICVPTFMHYDVAMQVINHGAHLLVEKPIATTIKQAQEIIDAAQAANLKLTVGHVERFNPAVIALHHRIALGELGRVFQVSTHRASPFPLHVTDIGVTIDLAVHDLDVMRYVTGSEVSRIYAETARRIHPSHEDQMVGLLRFSNGALGELTINWLTPTKMRELTVLGERGMFVVNYITQDLLFYENAAIQHGTDWETLGVLRGVNEGPMTRYVVPKKEPLRAELEAFTKAVHGEGQLVVTGFDGLQALHLAQALVESGETHTMIVE